MGHPAVLIRVFLPYLLVRPGPDPLHTTLTGRTMDTKGPLARNYLNSSARGDATEASAGPEALTLHPGVRSLET